MPKTLSIVLVVVMFALAAALAVIGYTWVVGSGPTGVPAVTEEPEASDTPGLVLPEGVASYASSSLGISFQYPKSYRLEEFDIAIEGGTLHHIALTASAGEERAAQEGEASSTGEAPPAITVDTYTNASGTTLVDWMRTNRYSNFSLGSGAYVKTDIAGKEALAFAWSGLYQGYTILVMHRGAVVAVSVTFNAPEDAIRADFAQVVQSLSFKD